MSFRIINHLFNGYARTVQRRNIINPNLYQTTTINVVRQQSNHVSVSDEPIQMENPFEHEKSKCILCRLNIHPNYKNVRLLSQFQSPYTGRIYGRNITGLCKQKQEQVEHAILISQRAGYMSTYHKGVEFLKDPKLFDPERPIRPHNY